MPFLYCSDDLDSSNLCHGAQYLTKPRNTSNMYIKRWEWNANITVTTNDILRNLRNFHALRTFTVHPFTVIYSLKRKKKKRKKWRIKIVEKNWSTKNIEISSSIETITSLRNAEFITQYVLTNRAIDNRTFYRLNTYNRYIPYFSISYIFRSIKNSLVI